MSLATSAQVLELMANDTPDRYRAEAREAVKRAAILGSLSATHLGIAGWNSYQTVQNYFPWNVLSGALAVMTAANSYFIGRTAWGAVQVTREFYEMADQAGTQDDIFLSTTGRLAKLQLTMDKPNAAIVRPYADLADIPGSTDKVQLGAVNGVNFGMMQITSKHTQENGTLVLEETIGPGVLTRNGPSPTAITPKVMELIHQQKPGFVIAHPTQHGYCIHGIGDAIDFGQYCAARHAANKKEARATPLVWTPAHT